LRPAILFIFTDTMSGVELARKPPLWVKLGDVCEVELERLGVLPYPVSQQAKIAPRADFADG
jgi:acylpyruvate hydrolase